MAPGRSRGGLSSGRFASVRGAAVRAHGWNTDTYPDQEAFPMGVLRGLVDILLGPEGTRVKRVFSVLHGHGLPVRVCT